MKYTGTYLFTIENGQVPFPWDINTEDENMWVIFRRSESENPICFILNIADYEEIVRIGHKYSDDFSIIAKGDFVPDKSNTWTVPDAVADFVKGDKIDFIGLDTRIEIFGENIYDENEQYF